MSDLIKLDKADFPTGQVSLAFNRPYYKDLRTSRRHYPTPQNQNDQGPPYSPDELLIAQKLDNINGNRPWEKPTSKMDTVDRIASLDIADRQFLTAFFVEALYASQEELKEARNKGDEIKLNYKQSYTIPANDMPTGEHSVSFRRPNSGVQMEVDRRWQGQSVNGCTMEEMLLAYCLETVDGEDVSEKPKDVVSILDNWEISDVQFLSMLFVQAFSMDESEGENARQLAKKKGGKKSAKKGKKSSPASPASEEPKTSSPSTA